MSENTAGGISPMVTPNRLKDQVFRVDTGDRGYRYQMFGSGEPFTPFDYFYAHALQAMIPRLPGLLPSDRTLDAMHDLAAKIASLATSAKAARDYQIAKGNQ